MLDPYTWLRAAAAHLLALALVLPPCVGAIEYRY